jgi:hypothetical protein
LPRRRRASGPMTPSEREAFVVGFYAPEYVGELAFLRAFGFMNAEDGEE